MENYHRHIHHETQRYASYWMNYYWADQHGIDMVAKVWRQALEPEDPIQAYMRITNIDVATLNNEVYDAATRFVTRDLDAIRTYGKSYMDQFTYDLTTLAEGGYQVDYSRCPGTTGYNVIRLNVPQAGVVVSTAFTGVANAIAIGFNTVDAARAGWRYGYVALCTDGSRVYSDRYEAASGTADFTIPENCEMLWFVVTGAPTTYEPHAWDDDDTNDDQWPYQLKITNTDLYGTIGTVTFDGTEVPEDITFTYDVTFAASGSSFNGATVAMGEDAFNLAYAFVLQPLDITHSLNDEIAFYAIDCNGALAATADDDFLLFYNSTGDVVTQNDIYNLFTSYDEETFTFSIGQYNIPAG